MNGTDNSATTPAVTGTDTDTGVYYPAANQVALATNGTLALLVDSSQNVTIGTTTQNLTLQQNTASGSNSTSYPGYIAFTGFGWNTALGSSPLGVRLAAGGNYTPDLGNVAPGLSISTQNTNGSMTQRMLLNGFGIGLGTGTYPISGTGIKFPATLDASNNANTLDDYEEGTWTPVFTGVGGTNPTVTYAAQVGTYTKVGNRVMYEMVIYTTAASGGSGTLAVSLPFATSNGANQYHCAVVGYSDNISSPVKTGYTDPGRADMFLTPYNASSGNLPVSSLTNAGAGILMMQGQYLCTV